MAQHCALAVREHGRQVAPFRSQYRSNRVDASMQWTKALHRQPVFDRSPRCSRAHQLTPAYDSMLTGGQLSDSGVQMLRYRTFCSLYRY